MRIFAAVILVLLGSLSLPVSSGAQLKPQDEMALMAVVDTLMAIEKGHPVVLSPSSLRMALGVPDARALNLSDRTRRDSLWLAEPDEVARCNGGAMPRCVAIRISKFEHSGDVVEIEVHAWAYRGCGYSDDIFRVEISSVTARVIYLQERGSGDCGMRSGKPLPPDGSGALQIPKQ